jgi:ABC-type multidrug transport system fused ATPase/permease subunit
MLIFVSWKSLFKKKSFISEAFFTVFLISSLMILKQSPRYYMIPTILAFIWIAENIQNPLLWIMFSLINLTAFHDYYLDGYKNQAPYDYEFRVGPFHDNARDFRAFQRVFVWLTENNCANDLAWVESDRFGKQIDFLKISAPTSNNKKPCPWPKEDLFFSYIPNYDPKFFDVRTENNTNPPWPNVKFLMHKPEWGDLALWIRKKDNQ